jgi:di/tricarboxylate transporter
LHGIKRLRADGDYGLRGFTLRRAIAPDDACLGRMSRGSKLTLLETPANVIGSNAAEGAGLGPIRFFEWSHDAVPRAALAGLFRVTAAITKFIATTSAALIMIPIAVATASELCVSAPPLLMGVTMSASAAFLTRSARR